VDGALHRLAAPIAAKPPPIGAGYPWDTRRAALGADEPARKMPVTAGKGTIMEEFYEYSKERAESRRRAVAEARRRAVAEALRRFRGVAGAEEAAADALAGMGAPCCGSSECPGVHGGSCMYTE